MKNKKLKNILEIIFIIAFLIFTIVYILLTKKYELVIKIIIAVIITLISTLIFGIKILNHLVNQKSIKKNYEYLLTKNNKTLFEECFVLAYQNKLDNLLKQVIEKKEIKHLNSLKATIVNIKRIIVNYKYMGFEVYIFIINDKIFYMIDSPSRYDGLKSNINLEKVQKTEVDLDNFTLLDDFAYNITDLILEINTIINNFTKDNIVHELFNGRLLNKFKNYLSFLKREGLICSLLGIPITAFLIVASVITVMDPNYRIENPPGFYTVIIICPVLTIFFIWLNIYGIICLKRKHDFQKDFKQKIALTITDKPYKVSIKADKPGKHSSTFYLVSVTFHFKNIKLILPLPNKPFNNHKVLKKCQNECLNISASFKYLPNSKIIIDGGDKYINIINKHLRLDL